MKWSRISLLVLPIVAGLVVVNQAFAYRDGVDLPSPGIVSETPVSFTPTVPGDWGGPNQEFQITSFAPNTDDGVMYASGLFTEVKNSQGTSFSRDSLFAFDPNTGAVSSFNAGNINGFVWTTLYYGGSLYIGGDFTNVNGAPASKIAKLDPITGAVDQSWGVSANGTVTDLDIAYGTLVVAGKFTQINGVPRSGLANIGLTSGNVGSKINPSITGTIGWTAASGTYRECTTGIYKVAKNKQGTKMVVAGCFTSIDGKPRHEIAVFDMTSNGIVIDNWRSYDSRPDKHGGKFMCEGAANVAPIEDIDFDPDGRYFYGVSSGGNRARLCDSVFKFDSQAAGGVVHPNWVRYTTLPDGGGDTLRSVEASSDTVYVAGHQRYLQNNQGVSKARDGIGALTSGGGLRSWNPGHDRQIGSRELFFTNSSNYSGFPTGLWVGSDSGGCGKNVGVTWDTQGICFFPMP